MEEEVEKSLQRGLAFNLRGGVEDARELWVQKVPFMELKLPVGLPIPVHPLGKLFLHVL